MRLRLVGYDLRSKGYRLIDENGKLYKRRDVIFNENDFGHCDISPMATIEETVDVKEEVEEVKPVESEPQEPRRSGRTRRPPLRFMIDEYVDSVIESESEHVALISLTSDEPVTLEEALQSSNASEWKAAADAEYKSLMDNETWKLVELPPERKSIGCKWVFRTKLNENGEVERFKARLVAKGYAQTYGIDYE